MTTRGKEKTMKPGKRERAMLDETIGPDSFHALTAEGSRETILTTDMGMVDDRNGANRKVERLKRENDELMAENHLLSRQLYLAKHNASLRVVTILTEVLNWLDIQGTSSYGLWNTISVEPSEAPYRSSILEASGTPHIASPADQPVEERGPGISLRDLMSPNPVRRTGAGSSLSKEEREAFLMPQADPSHDVFYRTEKVKESVTRSSTPVSEPVRRSHHRESLASPDLWSSPRLRSDSKKDRRRSKTPEPHMLSRAERRSISKSPVETPNARHSRSSRREVVSPRDQFKPLREEYRSYREERSHSKERRSSKGDSKTHSVDTRSHKEKHRSSPNSYSEDKGSHKEERRSSRRESSPHKEERRSSRRDSSQHKERGSSRRKSSLHKDERRSPILESQSKETRYRKEEEHRSSRGNSRSRKEERSHSTERRSSRAGSRSHKGESKSRMDDNRFSMESPRGFSRSKEKPFRLSPREMDPPSYQEIRSQTPPALEYQRQTPSPYADSRRRSRSRTPTADQPRNGSIEMPRRASDYPPKNLLLEEAPGFMQDVDAGVSGRSRDSFLTIRKRPQDELVVEEVHPGSGGTTRESFLTTRKVQDMNDDGINVTYNDVYTSQGNEKEEDAQTVSSREFTVSRTEYRTGPSGTEPPPFSALALPENNEPFVTTPGTTIRSPRGSFREENSDPLARELFPSNKGPMDEMLNNYGDLGYSSQNASHVPRNNSPFERDGVLRQNDLPDNNITPDNDTPPFARTTMNTIYNKAMHNNKKIPSSRRLIGEIAFQLDRRILNYVFTSGLHQNNKDRRRFYGYIIQNIPDKIEREATNCNTGDVDPQKKAALNYRFQYLLKALRPLGYDVKFHSELSVDLVNKYGLLPLQSSRGPKNALRDIVLEVAPDAEREDIIILLNCLAMMAKDDGKPMLMFT